MIRANLVMEESVFTGIFRSTSEVSDTFRIGDDMDKADAVEWVKEADGDIQ
jgi:hypothetical protein